MSKQKTVYGSAFFILALIVFVFYSLIPEDAKLAKARTNSSVFEESYWDNSTDQSADLEIGEEYAELNRQVNPKTGRTYSGPEIQRVIYLRERFPENDLIPLGNPEANTARKTRRQQELEDLRYKISASQADSEETDRYFDRQRKMILDRLQLVRFVLEEEDWGPAIRKKYISILETGQKEIKRIEKQRNRELALWRKKQK